MRAGHGNGQRCCRLIFAHVTRFKSGDPDFVVTGSSQRAEIIVAQISPLLEKLFANADGMRQDGAAALLEGEGAENHRISVSVGDAVPPSSAPGRKWRSQPAISRRYRDRPGHGCGP